MPMRTDLANARQAFLANPGDDALLPIVDAHHHFWAVPENPHHWLTRLPRIPFRYGDYEAICKDFLPADYAHARREHLVLRHVVMEGEWNSADPLGESLWMHGLAQREGVPHAMAAQIWLDRDDVAAVLARYTQGPLAGFVRSVRHKPRVLGRGEPRSQIAVPGSMRCPRWRAGYAQVAASGLMFELQAPWWHMDEAVELARDFAGTRIVVNHAGLPAQRDADSLREWEHAMRQLAQCPNVVVKLSGLGVPGQAWTEPLQSSVVLPLLDAFGTSRCLFATNFPVDSLVADMSTIWSVFKALTRHLTAQERLALFCDNAVAVYGLE